MVVIGAVILLLSVSWFLLPRGSGLRSGGWRLQDEEEGPDSVPSDFGRWPGLAETPAESREATITRELLAGTVEPGVYRKLMAELARDDETSDGRHQAGPRA